MHGTDPLGISVNEPGDRSGVGDQGVQSGEHYLF